MKKPERLVAPRPRRRMGILLDDRGKEIHCVHCDRGAVIEWQGEHLCLSHFQGADRRRAADAARRAREQRETAERVGDI